MAADHCTVRYRPLFETSVDLPLIPATCSELQRLPVRTRSEVFNPSPRTYSNHFEYPLNDGHHIAIEVQTAPDRQGGLTTGRYPSSSE
jgi:hypothetical protein